MFGTNIERVTANNKCYRRVVYTDDKQQLVGMSLNPGEDIPLESHNGSQFFRVESGSGVARSKKKTIRLKPGSALIIPKNMRHHIKNTSKTIPLKMYTIYSPPQHKRNAKAVRQPLNEI